MKKILISQRLYINESYPETRDALDVNWGQLCEKIGILPIILPSSYPYQLYFNKFDIDGIILTGGNDLYTISNDPLSKTRDTLEIKLISHAIKNNIPILGICRGMQLIATFFNATITQIKNHVNCNHALAANKKSKFYHTLKKIKVVNSFHNYGVSTPENCITSGSHQQIIEAFEHKSKPIFAQMWHPERNFEYIDQNIDLIKKLFNIVRK